MELAKPGLSKLSTGVLKHMMLIRLAELAQLDVAAVARSLGMPTGQDPSFRRRPLHRPDSLKPVLSPIRTGLGLLLHTPRLAALGGALAVPTSGAAPGLGAETIVLAFAVAAIGGLGQIEGAALAAVIVGLARVVAIYFAPQLEAVAPYIVMLVVLLIRPYGLFGNDQARRI